MVYPCEECKEVEAQILHTENGIPVASLCVPCYELFTGTEFVVPDTKGYEQ